MTKSARIVGTGSYLPTRQITNEQIERMVRNFDPRKADNSPFNGLWSKGVHRWVDAVRNLAGRGLASSRRKHEH